MFWCPKEYPSEPLGVRRYCLAELGRVRSKLPRQCRSQTANTLPRLEHLTPAKLPFLQQVNHHCIRRRPRRLHQIAGERGAVALVGVHEAERWIETHPVSGDRRLGLEYRVEVVHDRMGGSLRTLGSLLL